MNGLPFEPTSRRSFLKATGGACVSGILAQAATAATDEADVPRRVFTSDREDGRFKSSPAFIHAYLKHLKRKLEFDPGMTPQDFPAWRSAVRTKLLELMGFPEFDQPQPPPKRLWMKQRDGYLLEKWEAYPEPYSVVPYLVLIPDGASAQSPAAGNTSSRRTTVSA